VPNILLKIYIFSSFEKVVPNILLKIYFIISKYLFNIKK